MKVYPLCDPYFWEQSSVLWETGYVLKQRKEGPCISELVNHLALIWLTALVVAIPISVVLRNSYPFYGILLLGAAYSLPLLWAIYHAWSRCEGFQDASSTEATAAPPSEPAGVNDPIPLGGAPATARTLPTTRNPFMNVLVDELLYNPMRGEAVSVQDPSVKLALDDFFRTEFNRDPTDVFGRSQSQRQFVTMPSTGIPNDQASYQTWLYKIPGKTCKEGGREACLPGTDGGVLPWMNVNR
jgi:hypothetical protein